MTALDDEQLAEMTADETGPVLVGRKLRALRHERGWSQEDLAGRLDRTQTAVSYWESGKRSVGWEDLLNICDVFDVQPTHFLNTGPSMPKPSITVTVGGDTALLERQARVIGMHFAKIGDQFVKLADSLAEIRRKPTPSFGTGARTEQQETESD